MQQSSDRKGGKSTTTRRKACKACWHASALANSMHGHWPVRLVDIPSRATLCSWRSPQQRMPSAVLRSQCGEATAQRRAEERTRMCGFAASMCEKSEAVRIARWMLLHHTQVACVRLVVAVVVVPKHHILRARFVTMMIRLSATSALALSRAAASAHPLEPKPVCRRHPEVSRPTSSN